MILDISTEIQKQVSSIIIISRFSSEFWFDPYKILLWWGLCILTFSVSDLSFFPLHPPPCLYCIMFLFKSVTCYGSSRCFLKTGLSSQQTFWLVTVRKAQVLMILFKKGKRKKKNISVLFNYSSKPCGQLTTMQSSRALKQPLLLSLTHVLLLLWHVKMSSMTKSYCFISLLI